MATELDVVYKHFLGKIEDAEWLLIEDVIIYDLMRTYLNTSISLFRVCEKDLTIVSNKIVGDLDYLEIEILAKGMLIQYLSPKIICEENLKQAVTSKDYYNPSNANMLDKLIKLKEVTMSEYKQDISDYDYMSFKGLN